MPNASDLFVKATEDPSRRDTPEKIGLILLLFAVFIPISLAMIAFFDRIGAVSATLVTPVINDQTWWLGVPIILFGVPGWYLCNKVSESYGHGHTTS